MCWFDCFKTRKAKPLPQPPFIVDYEDLFNDLREPLVLEDEDYRYNLVFEPYDPNDPSILI